ncbi:MAG TPA: hydrogenase maturation protease [bacterium]|nr:hydrogenase maturation protease [bacterium]
MAKKRYAVGLGTYAQSDDGIGLHIIEHLNEKALAHGFEAIEVGNNGLQLINLFADQPERIVVVDCAYIGKKPGELLVFTPDDVMTQKVTGTISTHEGDILKLIALARQLNYAIPPITILGIQPQSTANGMELSPALQDNIPLYVQVVIEEIFK